MFTVYKYKTYIYYTRDRCMTRKEKVIIDIYNLQNKKDIIDKLNTSIDIY